MSSFAATNDNGGILLVIGGGIAGLTCAIEAAEAGREVVLVEKSASLGGRVAAFHRYFPKLCPPPCGLEIDHRRAQNTPRLTILTLAELESLHGEPGAYEAVVRIHPRYVTPACTLCGACAPACPVEVPDSFNYGLSKTRAIHLPHWMASPAQYVVERASCPQGCGSCASACKYGAIDLSQQETRKTFQAAAVVLATGWAPYDARKIENLGFGRFPDVITNVMMERLAAPDGPTQGRILRPSDGKPPRSVAFVQCAGSRDRNHLPYCSGVCCTASLKQARYVRAQQPEAHISMFYIDLRTPGELQNFAARAVEETGIELVKGKIGRVEERAGGHELVLTAEDVLAGKKIERAYDLVVLAVGMTPQSGGLPQSAQLDEFGFACGSTPGVMAAGCVKRPTEVSAAVRDATGAALKAIGNRTK